jgi:hypothetical protein
VPIRSSLNRRTLLKSIGAGGALTTAGLSRAALAEATTGAIPIGGLWSVRLDPGNIGIKEGWPSVALAAAHPLPNSLPALRIGNPITVDTPWTGTLENRDYYHSVDYAPYREAGKVKIPFFLQPEAYYSGAAWYQREVVVPRSWADRRVVLFLERAHWETQVWIDGKPFGRCNSLSTPHEYDLGLLKPGKHLLSIRVDNSLIYNIGTNSHAISDHTQGNWNGMVGEITLKATAPVWIDDLQLYPEAKTRSVRVKGDIKSLSGKPGHAEITLSYGKKKTVVPASWSSGSGHFEAVVKFPGDAKLWDEFSPALHTLSARLGASDPITARFGFRDLGATRTHITINERPVLIRGTLECCIFPETGHPPTEKSAWARIFKIARSFGLNMMRFHSYCPPKAAFEAADEAGVYCQVETCWANHSTTLGDGKPVDQWVKDETDRILKAYGNHPSFVFMLYGNEPSGPKDRNPYLSAYVTHYKAVDPRRLWSGGAGWPELPENDFHLLPEPRIQRWGEQLNSRVNARPPETVTDYSAFISKRTVPVMSHEIGEWCVYPDFGEVDQYTGYLKPKNFEIFRDRLQQSGLSHLASSFLISSGKLQTLLYKEEIEASLRTQDMAGFQLLDLHDFPGQGTALVGVLNPFWREKGYVTAAEYSRFCNATVPLVRLEKRVFTSSERLTAPAEVSHFGAYPYKHAQAYWRLEAGGTVKAQGQFDPVDIAIGGGQPLGKIDVDLSAITQASACKLVIGVKADALAGPCENDWDVWVYPAEVKRPDAGVQVVSSVDEAIKLTGEGKTVILSLPKSAVRNYEEKPVKFGFSTIFWNTSWTNRQAPTTLGICCDPKHPAFSDFPTEAHTNWQWWYLAHRAAPLRMDLMPKGSDAIVRVIDDWFTARSLALIAEFKCGEGKLIVCGFDLTNIEASDSVSRQMRASLRQYAASDAFSPRSTIDAASLRALTV